MIRSSRLLFRRCPSETLRWHGYQNQRSTRFTSLSSKGSFELSAQRWTSARCLATSANPNNYSSSADDESKNFKRFSKIVRGNGVEFDASRKIAGLADSSVVGKSGDSVALTNIVVGSSTTPRRSLDIGVTPVALLADALARRCQQENSSSLSPLTVDYRQRHHAVGKIPTSANRTDNRRPLESEILAARAIDRSLRPLLRKDAFWNHLSKDPLSIHLSCSIQAYSGGHPVSLALNSAAVALQDRLSQPLAAIALVLMEDGTVLVNPSKLSILQAQQSDKEEEEEEEGGKNGIVGNLLYAGTKDSIVMMEFSGMISEAMLLDLIGLAHESLQPIIKAQENVLHSIGEASKKYQQDHELREQLGLTIESDESKASTDPLSEFIKDDEFEIKAKKIYQEASDFIDSRLRNVTLRLFGVEQLDDVEKINRTTENGTVTIHSEGTDGALLGKVVRGRREALVNEEIKRVLADFEPSDSELSKDYQNLLQHDKSIIETLGGTIHSKILRAAMKDSSIVYKSRADGRGNSTASGSNTIRPLS